MRIELDFPPADLFPNRANGKHWGSVYATKKKYREACGWATKAQIRPLEPPKRIALTLTYLMADGRHRDVDNLLAASKAGLDAMAEALGVNDKIFEPLTIKRVYKAPAAKLIVELEMCDE